MKNIGGKIKLRSYPWYKEKYGKLRKCQKNGKQELILPTFIKDNNKKM